MQLINTYKTLQNVTVLIHSFIDINLVLNSKHCEINETNKQLIK